MKNRLYLAIVLFVATHLIAHASINYPHLWHQLSSEHLIDKGMSFNKSNQNDSALICFAIAASKKENKLYHGIHDATAFANYQIGNLYSFYYYNFELALDYLMLANKSAEESNDSTLLSHIYFCMGYLYAQLNSEGSWKANSLQKTNHYYLKAYRYSHPDDSVNQNALFNLITINLYHHNSSVLLPLMHEYSGQHPPQDQLYGLCQAAICVASHRDEEALQWLDRSIILMNANPRKEGILRLSKFKILEQMGRDSEAVAELDEYERIVRENGFLIGIPDIYNQKYLFYSHRGNETLAKEYRLKYYETVDSLNEITHLPYISKASTLFDLQKAIDEIHVQETHYERLWLVLRTIAIAFVIVLILLTLLYRRNKQLKESYQSLYQQNLERLAMIDESRKYLEQMPEVTSLTQNLEIDQKSDGETEQSAVNVDDSVLHCVYQRVVAVMETAPEIFDKSFTFSRLHELVGGNAKYISQAINTYAHCDFRTLLGQYRIREACRRINDMEHYGNYTIDAIAKSVGIMSRTSFIQNFKKQTGLTPSVYLRMARSKQSAALLNAKKQADTDVTSDD